MEKAKTRAWARSIGPSLGSESCMVHESSAHISPEGNESGFALPRSAAPSVGHHARRIARVVYSGHAHHHAGPVSPANHFWFNAAMKTIPFIPAAAA